MTITTTCPKCGSKLRKKDLFCAVCGTPIEDAPQAETVRLKKSKKSQVSNEGGFGINNEIALAAVILAVFAALAFWVYPLISPKNGPEVQNTAPQNNTTQPATQQTTAVVGANPNMPSAPAVPTYNWETIMLGANPVTQDGVDFSVNFSILGKTISNSGGKWGVYDDGRTTTGNFVQVDLTMKNTTTSTIGGDTLLGIEADPVNLYDQTGGNFPVASSDLTEASSSPACAGTSGIRLQPATSCTLHFLYDASDKSKNFLLSLQFKK